jgi:hypothetical protein
MDRLKYLCASVARLDKVKETPFCRSWNVGTDLAFYAKHIRKMEVEEIASIIGARWFTSKRQG